MKLPIQLKISQQLFFTSDLHDKHTNALDFDKRPFKDIYEMHDTLVSNWNGVVHKNDTVLILGDLTFKPEDANELLRELHGKKYLIIGNHDNYLFKKEFDQSLLAGYMELADLNYKGYHLVCCHYPLEEWNRKHFGSIHLHGHDHGEHISKLPNRYNVCAPMNNYTPVTLEQMIQKYGYDDSMIPTSDSDY